MEQRRGRGRNRGYRENRRRREGIVRTQKERMLVDAIARWARLSADMEVLRAEIVAGIEDLELDKERQGR